METDDDLLKEFLQESRDHLASIEGNLLAMEEAGANVDEELVNQVFRAAHSIKGGAGFFNLGTVQKLAHSLENSLSLIRSKEMVATPEAINILLMGFDRLREMINNTEASHGMDVEDLVLALTGLTTSHLAEGEKGTLAAMIAIPTLAGHPAMVQMSEFDFNQAVRTGQTVYLLELDLLHDVHRRGKTPLGLFKDLMDCGTLVDCAWDLEAVGELDDDRDANGIPFQVLYSTVLEASLLSHLVDMDEARLRPVTAAAPLKAAPAPVPVAAAPAAPAPEPPKPQAAPAAAPEAAYAETSLRVNLLLLEKLMNLAGEMVLSRNQLMEAIARQDQRSIIAGGHRINLVTSELQEVIMQTRMQPVGNVLNRFPRVVRDLSRELGKDIELTMTGKDVEIDRTILEGLTDPLTHMVRNAVDHGIELPEVRRQSGKPGAGKLELRVYHEAGQVVVEIRDDGKGIDLARIAAKAVEKGLVSAEVVRTMSDKEKGALIMLPGLSTAEAVSNLSGRGVGMDVVKTNIEKLGGVTDIETQAGQGTTFRIRLPLTLAIVPSLLVTSGGAKYAIPQVGIAELLRIAPDQVAKRIELIGAMEVLLLRGELIPLIRLADVLGQDRTYVEPGGQDRAPDRRQRLSDRRSRKLEAGPEEAGQPRMAQDRRYHDASHLSVAVLNAGALKFGLVVEELHDTVEIVVKPLGRHFKGMREYAGATILGDGSLALILDGASIVDLAGITSQQGTPYAAEVAAHAVQEADRHTFLLFHNAPGELCALPLEQVARVEKVEAAQIETKGGRRTMQYRGGSLTLVKLEDKANVLPLVEETEDLVVIVFEAGGRELGLLAALPIDSVEVALEVDEATHRQPGIAGSAIIKDATTLILDIHELVGEARVPAEPRREAEAGAPPPKGKTLLLAEDSDFFRNQVRRFLESDGYQVLAAEDGQVAWEKLNKHAGEVQGVVSDIEMPRMDGFQLVQRIRSDPRFAHLPVIALTSLAGEDDVDKGKALGFTEYQVKLDKERLLDGLRRVLGDARDDL